jgi:hypothetical protein
MQIFLLRSTHPALASLHKLLFQKEMRIRPSPQEGGGGRKMFKSILDSLFSPLRVGDEFRMNLSYVRRTGVVALKRLHLSSNIRVFLSLDRF